MLGHYDDRSIAVQSFSSSKSTPARTYAPTWNIVVHDGMSGKEMVESYVLDCQRSACCYFPMYASVESSEMDILLLSLHTAVPDCSLAITPIRPILFHQSPLVKSLLTEKQTELQSLQ